MVQLGIIYKVKTLGLIDGLVTLLNRLLFITGVAFMKNGEKKCFKYKLLLIGFIILVFFIKSNKVDASQDEEKNVLFISSYSESFITVPDQIIGLQKVFNQNNVNLEIEYMDTKRYSSDENIKNFYTSLEFKLKNSPTYDAVIVGDDAALQFAIDYQDKLFSELPIVFIGINDRERAVKAASNPYITGIFEEVALADNIKLARHFNPEATKVMAIVDNTLTGLGDQKQIEAVSTQFDDLEFRILNVSNYSYDRFGTILEGIGKDTILLFIDMNQDNTGDYLNLGKQFELIKEHTKVPVYRINVGGVGDGLFGGKMIDYEKFGIEAADLIMEVFAGKSIESMPLIEETPYFYKFDYNIIKKYNINEKLIPEGAILVNKKINPLEKYRKYIIAIEIAFAFLSMLAIVLIIDNIKRRKMQKELQDSHDELTAIYEELTASEEELQMQYNIVQQHDKQVNMLYEKYDIAITGTNSAVWELHLDTKELELSKNIELIVNKSMPESGDLEQVLETFVHSDYREPVLTEIEKYIDGEKEEVNIQVPTNGDESERRWILIRGKGIKDREGEINKIYGIFLDVTAMKEQEEYIEYNASHDYLTHLPNRMKFIDTLSAELRKKGKGAVLLFDIDDFKSINDTLGHVYGDELLKQIADRLRSISDNKMLAARMGGDEFLILLKNVSTTEKVDCYVEKIKSAFTEIFSFQGIENHIKISMGITFYPKDSENINQLIMNADTAMYKVKHNGKNSCIYYHEDMRYEIKLKKEIESILRHAMKENGFCLYYQPQVDMKTGMIVGFEALLRLKDYSIGPGEFIPVAEESGNIIEIGRWVAKEAIKQIADWRDKGLDEKTVAINYSAKQLRDKGYIDYVRQLLKEYDIKAEYLEIEITESILLENDVQTIEFLQELQRYGFKIALDDFGTGYSSLNYLTYIPVDKIKLDKSIIDKFLEFQSVKVIESLISLAHSLNLKITAEGIEDQSKFEKLRQSDCDYIQGYLFSKPLNIDEVEKIYNKNLI